MQVDVKLFASLREGRFESEKAELENQSRVIDVIKKYNIPLEEVHICLVDGRDADTEHVLQDGNTVSLFPPVGGA
ncbi:Molybdopterin converting factor, small subunit [Natronincola peptidivorans]|uniref:Molybdopterin converting factor, small subunit n=1 Tax=Natronincola peptidivorans TaxID=426128 RepID=A0A1I0CIM0_9FIRM|nr:MoaD/ThiS family protein [Natronincola peptidivorans]SET19004.1 Molybdopterin converting factor, small subunit [Natronincola peptidivorans]